MRRLSSVIILSILCLSMLFSSLVRVSASSPPGQVQKPVSYAATTYELLLWGNPLINNLPDTSVTGFKIYKDGNLLATVDWHTCFYRDYNVQPDVTYSYGVSAVNSAGEGPVYTWQDSWYSNPNTYYYNLTLYCNPPQGGYTSGLYDYISGQTTAGKTYMPAMVLAYPYSGYNFTGPWTSTGSISITYYDTQPICYINSWSGAATITTYFKQLPAYSVTISAHDNTEGTDVSVPITMDGASTGYNTPHVFSSLTGTHTFAVPSTDPSGHPFTQWNTGETTTTITVAGGGTYTAYYQAPPPPTYNVTINAHCNAEGADINVGITKDGSSTGFNTPYTFTALTGTHTFAVPSMDSRGHPFKQWSTGQLTTTITVSSGGTYTAYYACQSSTSVSCSPNPVSVGSSVTCKATVSGSNPTGTVTWSTSSITGSFIQSVCSLSSGSCSTTYTDSNAGSVTITASYSGDSNNVPSNSSTTLTYLRSSPAQFGMHWASPYYGVTAGQQTIFVIYVDYSPGFGGTVTLSFQGLPEGCTAKFDFSTLSPPVSYRTLFVTTPLTLNNGTYTFTVNGESGGVSQTIPVTLTVGTGEITGVVYRDDNGNGVRDPGEPAVSGATIGYYATQNYMNFYVAGATSNSSGGFTLVNVPFNVDNEVDATAAGLAQRSIHINIMNQPETHLDIGMSTPPASGWKTCTQFNIASSSVSFSQYLQQISVNSLNSLPPVNCYMITPSSSADQAEFAQALTQFFGITVPTGYNPACVCILELPYLQTINALFSTNIQGPITISIPSSGGVNLVLSALSISTTPKGSLVLAFTFSKVANNNQGIFDTLQAIARDLLSLAKETDLKALVTTGVDTLNSITKTLGDVSVSVITSDLDQTGQLNSHTLLDIVRMANTLSTLSTASGILMKLIDLLCGGAEVAATSGLDVLADVQTIVHAYDWGLEILPYLPGLSFLNNNILYHLFMTGEGMIVKATDPNGTTAIPSVYDMKGSLVLGYNFSSGDIVYSSSEGILIPAASDWVALLNESASNPVNYTICFNAVGGNASVPYNLQILSPNQNVTAIGYAGMVLGGTSTIIPVNIAPNGTLIQQVYLDPAVSVSETGNIFNFIATGMLSNRSLASVTRAFLIINGSQYEMTRNNSSTFEIQTAVNSLEPVQYFVYMISPSVPGGFASGVLLHGVAITGIAPSSFEAYPTWTAPLKINVTIKNLGDFNESFPVTLYWNSTHVIGTQNVTLPIGETMDVNFTWTIPTIPKAYPYPIYALSANATVPGNINSGILIGGNVTVKWPGDANGDGHVNGYDLYIMAVSWHQSKGSPLYDPRADFNGDGTVNGFDLYWLAVNWHRGPLD